MVEKSAIRILALDDDPFVLKLLVRMLTNLGFTSVTTCDSGQSALEEMDHADRPPDVIVLDLNMPEMDGVEFVRHLVEHHYAGSLILASGEDERMLETAEKLVQAHRITVLGHLQKPLRPERLAALLEKWTPLSEGKPRAERNGYGADELRAAITNGELVNYYQPKVAVATGEVVGVETLVRWRHPVDGLVFPDQFIGVAEAHGLIDHLTRVVMWGALAQAKVWQEAGLALRVAVNVSMDNLSSLDFADFVARLAAEAGVPPQEVVLEVTESRLMKDLRAPLEILTRLRLKRFHLSIDDFGTGHSSLAQLRDIPFDELKIDRGFVHRAWTDETRRAIYDASLGLAKQLGMEIVAEGVEDREDWDFLKRTGCHLAQGYFIARPMPAADLPGWVKTWQEQTRRASAPHLESAPSIHAVAEGVRPTLLVVDDDRFQHRIVARLLQNENYRLEFAASGSEALKVLRKTRPDLILMDVLMPDMDGLDVTRQVKAVPRLTDIPVIMITGNSEKDIVTESLKAGAIDFVVKPFCRETLIARIAKALGTKASPQ